MRNKIKVYISGPIAGIPDYLDRFASAEEELTEAGFVVMNPAKIQYEMPSDTTQTEYMSISMRLLEMCDAIFMLSGWEYSRGAMAEYHYAHSIGLDLFETDGDKFYKGVF